MSQGAQRHLTNAARLVTALLFLAMAIGLVNWTERSIAAAEPAATSTQTLAVADAVRWSWVQVQR